MMVPRQSARQSPVIVVEPRYIDRVKLADLLARLFSPNTYAAEVRGPSVTVARHFQLLMAHTMHFYRSDEGNGSYQRLLL
jgi:hypothetical protein